MATSFLTKTRLTATVICGFMSSAFAGETKIDRLVAMSNDRDTVISDISFVTDHLGVVFRVSYLIRENGKVTGQKSFPVAQLTTADGVVLEEERGVKALSLHGKVNSQSGQSSLYIRFVANGLTGEFKTCAMRAVRNPKGVWQLLDFRSLKPITQAKMLTWALGIQTIEGICPAELAFNQD
jgi:hypothetical protein